MARTDITVTDISDPKSAGGAYGGSTKQITLEAADTTNQNRVKLTGREILIANNTDTADHNITITSTEDDLGRTEDIASETIAAGNHKVFGPVRLEGWIQSDGYLYFEADNSSVEFAVLRTP